MTINGGTTFGVKTRRSKKNGKWTARRNGDNNNRGGNRGGSMTRDKIPEEMYRRYGDALVEILVARNAHGVAQKRANIEREQSLINTIIARMFGELDTQQRQQFDIGNNLGAIVKDLRQHEAQCKSLNMTKLSSMVRMGVQVAKERMQRGVDPCLPLTIDQEIRIMQGRGNDADTEAMLLLMETDAEAMNEHDVDSDSIDADDHRLEPAGFVSQGSLNNTAVNQWLTETYRRGVKRNRISDGMNADVTGVPTDTKDAESMMKAGMSKSSIKKGRKEQGNDDSKSKGDGAKEEEIISEIVKKRLKERKRQKTEGKTNSSGDSGSGIVMVANRPTTRFSDIGGIESVLDDIRELIEYPFSHPEIYLHLGVEPPRGILLHGPPGSGKTMLAHAIAGELGVPFFKVSAPEVVSGMSGESEKHLRQLFKDAVECAPSLIFIDEIDAITPKRETASREMEKRIVAQLLICMDESSFENTEGKVVMVVGATNRPDALDIGLRRTGRFDREISLGIPDTKARAHILEVMCRKMRLSGEIDFMEIAKLTPGYVGADIQALTKEAAAIAIHRIFSDKNMLAILRQSGPNTTQGDVAMVDEDLEDNSDNDALMQLDNDTNNTLPRDGVVVSSRSQVIDSLRRFKQPFTEEQLQHINIEMMDFQEAVTRVQPSAKREGFAMIPDVTWEDIGALEEIRDELRLSIMEPIRNPEKFEKVGLTRPVGVLLFGPPGCGKTLLAKAIANSSGANFISVKGPELLNKYVGESERAVRQVFARASSSAPCVIFFDELDALCPKRGYDSGNASMERVVNQLLTEMDGMDSRKDVFVIAATNRPDIIDPAMLRPGRLDKLLYVPLPNKDERLAILKTLARKTPLDAMSVNLSNIASDARCENFSGADLAALVREASVQCLRQHLDIRTDTGENVFKPAAAASSPDLVVTAQHFEEAFARVAPSVSAKDRKMYAALARKVRSNSNRIPSSFSDEATTGAAGKDTTV